MRNGATSSKNRQRRQREAIDSASGGSYGSPPVPDRQVLAYIVPVLDGVLRGPRKPGVKAIVV